MRVGRIVELANQLAQAIFADGLQPGDAYPATDAIARHLGVSIVAANNTL